MVNVSFWASVSLDSSNSSHLFWNLEDSLLVQTLPCQWEENNVPPNTDWLFSMN